MMERSKETQSKYMEEFVEIMKKLPAELQETVCWTLKNCSVLKEIGRASLMTAEEIESAMEISLEKGDYAALMLLHITKREKESKENEEL